MKKHFIVAVLLSSLFATTVWAEPPAAPTKLPKYVAGTYVLLHKSVKEVPACNIDKNALEDRLKASVKNHGMPITPAVLFLPPVKDTALEYGKAIAAAWNKQGLPASNVVVAVFCDSTGAKVSSIPNNSLAPVLNVQEWVTNEKALRSTAATAPADYVAGVVEYLAASVEKGQTAQLAATKAKAQEQALAAAKAKRDAELAAAIAQQNANLAQQQAKLAAAKARAEQQAALDAARNRALTQPVPAPVNRQPVTVNAPATATAGNSNVGLIIMVVLLALTVLGIVIYLVVRRKDEDETPRSSGYSPRPTARGNVGDNTTGNNRPVVHKPAPVSRNTNTGNFNHPRSTSSRVYSNYSYGGRSYPVMERDIYGYIPNNVPESNMGFWVKNIASMVAVYATMEWLFNNGRRHDALSMGYVPGMDRDSWIHNQIHQSNLYDGRDYYHAPVMGHNSWVADNSPAVGDGSAYAQQAAQANRDSDWELGTDQPAVDLAVGDGSVNDALTEQAAEANRDDGWEMGTDAPVADLAVGDNEVTSESGLAVGDNETADSDNQFAVGDNEVAETAEKDDDFQFAVGNDDEEEAPAETGNDDYQVAVGNDEEQSPAAETGNDDFQFAVGNDDEEEAPAETGGNDDFQFAVGNDEEEEAPAETGNDDYQSSYEAPEEPASEPDSYEAPSEPDSNDDSNNDWT